MTQDRRFVTVDDHEPVARELLPPEVYDYYAGGAGDEWTLRENRRAFDDWVIRPRMLTGAYPPDPSTTILGTEISFPVLIAPWAYQHLAHPDGERATARAAASAGTIMAVSSTTIGFLEDVAAASSFAKWWQLYVYSDRALTAEMLRRVEASGFTAVCFTVDLPVVGLRHRDSRSGFEMAIGLPGDELVFDPTISWDDIAWVRDQTSLPILLKGILTAEDARVALEHGVDGIVVSNHGGRQLDGVAAGITVLPEVADAVAGRVFKALGLGAAAVMVGRPTVWGLAVAGERGVAEVLAILRNEFENAMALAGVRSVGEISGTFVTRA
jgi:isopentenyl diphosphate isomerase/L-lactate dehydrogenase-like FMN-dependent dehydrogenase